MPKFSVQVVGLDEAVIKMEKLSASVIGTTGRTMREWGEEVMEAAKLITPVDTGALRSSGNAEGPETSGKSVAVELTFGKTHPSSSYADLVHENLDPKVKWSVPGTGPKYLEKPFMAKLPEVPRLLEDALEEAAKTMK